MELFSRKAPLTGSDAVRLREVLRLFSEECSDVYDYSLLAMRAAAQFPAAARLFDELARVELAHLSQLGQYLLRYGLTPTPRFSPHRAAGGSFSLEQQAALEAALAARIKEEREGAGAYTRLAAGLQGTPAARMFGQIAAEEEEHAAAIEGLMSRMRQS
ncbi:MAG: hypothetical protein E7639_04910 [Ruminococcaceae bacterium]|nr:hypothetical protein [Oscillospiraceae bacterium]